MTEPKAEQNAQPCHQIDLGLSGTCEEYSKRFSYPIVMAFRGVSNGLRVDERYCLIAIFFSNS